MDKATINNYIILRIGFKNSLIYSLKFLMAFKKKPCNHKEDKAKNK